MLYQADDVVLAHIHERRSHLLAEAAAWRIKRRAQPPAIALLDRMLAGLGAHLVCWGDRLQARSRRAQTALAGPYVLE